jgi:hypothetical protein
MKNIPIRTKSTSIRIGLTRQTWTLTQITLHSCIIFEETTRTARYTMPIKKKSSLTFETMISCVKACSTYW